MPAIASNQFQVKDKDGNTVVAQTLPLGVGAGVAMELIPGSALPLPVGAATEVTGAAALAELKLQTAALKAQFDIASQVFTDTAGNIYIHIQKINEGTGVISSTVIDPITSAIISSTPAGFKPYGGGGGTTGQRAPLQKIFKAIAVGTGYAIGDYLGSVTVIDDATTSVALSGGAWLNLTQHTLLTAAPTSGTYVAEDQVIPSDVASAIVATKTWQDASLAAFGPMTDVTAADQDEGAYSLRRLQMRNLTRLAAQLAAVGPVSDVTAADLDEGAYSLRRLQMRELIRLRDLINASLVFAPIPKATVSVVAGATATTTSIKLATQASGLVSSYRVRNSTKSAGPIYWTLSTDITAKPVVPVPCSLDGSGGTVGDKGIDPGGVEVIRLSDAQLAGLAGAGLYLAVIAPNADVNTILSITPGLGAN